MQKGRNIAPFFVMMLSINLLIIAITYSSAEHLLKDSHEYLWQAKNIADGNGWYSSDPNEEYMPMYESYRPPAYGFFLYILQLIGPSILLALLLQAILAAISYSLIYDLLKRITSSKYTSALIFVCLIFFPSQFVYNNMLMTEVLFQFFICTSFYFLVRYFLDGKLLQVLFLNIALALAVLTKPVVIFCLIPLIGLAWYMYKRKRAIAHYVTALVPLLTILIIMSINYQRTEYFHYSSIKHKYELNYLAFLTLSDAVGVDAANSRIYEINKEANGMGSFEDRISHVSYEAKQVIKEHPLSFIKLNALGYAKFFLEPGRWDVKAYLFHGKHRKSLLLNSYYVIAGIVGLLLMVATIIFMILDSVPIYIRIAVALYLLYFLLIIGLNGTSRFRLPVYPIQLFAAIVLICSYLAPKSLNPEINK